MGSGDKHIYTDKGKYGKVAGVAGDMYMFM